MCLMILDRCASSTRTARALFLPCAPGANFATVECLVFVYTASRTAFRIWAGVEVAPSGLYCAQTLSFVWTACTNLLHTAQSASVVLCVTVAYFQFVRWVLMEVSWRLFGLDSSRCALLWVVLVLFRATSFVE